MSINIDLKVDLLNSSTKTWLSRIAQRQAFAESARDERTQKNATEEIRKRQRLNQLKEGAAGAASKANSSLSANLLASKRVKEKPAANQVAAEQLQVGTCYCSVEHDYATDDYVSYRLTTWKDHLIASGTLESYYPSGAGPSSPVTISVAPSDITTENRWGDYFYDEDGTLQVINGRLPPSRLSLSDSFSPLQISQSSGSSSSYEDSLESLILPVGGNVSIVAILITRRVFTGTLYRTTTRSYVGELQGDGLSFAGTSARAAYVFTTSTSVGYADGEFSYRPRAICFITNGTSSRQITCPPSLMEFMKNNLSSIPDSPQGLGIQVKTGFPSTGPVLGTPKTIGVVNGTPIEGWSKEWLQFSMPTQTSQDYVCRKISILDPTTKEPVDINSGRVIANLSRPVQPASMQGLSRDSYYLTMISWDWSRPDLCRRLLKQLGFSSDDLRL